MTDKAYLKALGSRLLSEANDLKRTPEALASEMGYQIETVRSVLMGDSPYTVARKLLEDISKHYPVSFGDVWIEQDDTNHGVLIMRGAQSDKSSRVFSRMNKNGEFKPYYDYRDTAMSRMAPFKPEWIRPLRYVSNSDPNNTDVAFNKGHMLHQTTFFIGAVNFYWELGEERHCAEMNTGDSNYISPFVPHSFASRDPENLGLILAVTYAGRVRAALNEFIRMDASELEGITGDLRDTSSAFRAVLKRQLAAESMSSNLLEELLVKDGLEVKRANILSVGNAVPTVHEVNCLAKIFEINPTILTVAPLTKQQEVVLRYSESTSTRLFSKNNRAVYSFRPLARTPHQPQLKGFELTVLGGIEPGISGICHGLHEYVYNYGNSPVTLQWNGGAVETLKCGDSAYISPMVSHSFGRVTGAEEGHLLVVRTPGRLCEETITEYEGFAPATRSRVTGETTKWF